MIDWKEVDEKHRAWQVRGGYGLADVVTSLAPGLRQRATLVEDVATRELILDLLSLVEACAGAARTDAGHASAAAYSANERISNLGKY